MTLEMAAWIASICVRFDALPFLWVGRFGSQYLLLPGYVWKPAGLA